jgi:hypothetical protein
MAKRGHSDGRAMMESRSLGALSGIMVALTVVTSKIMLIVIMKIADDLMVVMTSVACA